MSDKLITFLRILLSLIGMGLACGHRLPIARDEQGRARLRTAVLLVCAAASFYLYLELGPQFRNVQPAQIMNPHDFYHYYIGAKYHDELGYFDLYDCTAVADWESMRAKDPNWRIRDLRSYGFRRAASVARNPRRCSERFTPERWENFRSDVHYFSKRMSGNAWRLVLQDKGYNATPVWNAYASALTNLVPLDSAVRLYALLSLDYLFAAVLLLVVGRTFGWRNGLFVALFWGVNYMSSSTFVKGSISRLDWLVCLVLALCALKRGRSVSAGVLAGLATGSRLFPALFFVGLFFKFVWTAVRTRSIPRRYLRFGVAMLVTVGLLVGMTALTPAAREDWRDFSVKIRGHDEQIAGYRVGFKYSLIDPSPRTAAAQLESRRPIFWTASAVALLLIFVGARRLEDHQTLGLSFVGVFFLTAPTFYYYQDLVIPFLMFLPEGRRSSSGLGMSAFFGWCVLAYTLRLQWPLGMVLSHWLSWSLFALCLLIVVKALRQPGHHAPEEAAPSPV